ncbi:MAG: hypothetical protein ACOCXZ_02865 [Chloroflexota bacterium]
MKRVLLVLLVFMGLIVSGPVLAQDKAGNMLQSAFDSVFQSEEDDACATATLAVQASVFIEDFMGERPIAPFMAGDNLQARLLGLARRCGDDALSEALLTLFRPAVQTFALEFGYRMTSLAWVMLPIRA